MKKIVILLFALSITLYANLGAILLIPTSPKPIFSVYTGYMNVNAKTTIYSVNDDNHDTTHLNNNIDGKLIGVNFGLTNDYYMLTISYDKTTAIDFNQNRLLYNFDYMLGEQKQWQPTLGFGIGRSDYAYTISNEKIKFSTGVFSLRTGLQYKHNNHKFNLSLEYSHYLDSTNYTYNTNHFISYDIYKQNALLLSIMYQF